LISFSSVLNFVSISSKRLWSSFVESICGLSSASWRMSLSRLCSCSFMLWITKASVASRLLGELSGFELLDISIPLSLHCHLGS